jgi:3-hydroxybutyryl-CoA dehydratase
MAQQSRFGGIIACGPQITSLMMGILATYFTRNTAALGLEFSFRLHKAVKAEETIEMEWEIVTIEPKTSLAGEIVTLQGKATNEHGKAVLTATSKVLVTPSL